jgi:imidazoleglycerol-phosphate dehydratase
MRTALKTRGTAETQISVEVNLDGAGKAATATEIGFFDHMLDQLARHGGIDLTVEAEGDLHVDAHHTVEDTGICLGQAMREALGDCSGIARYGHAAVPMDEALAECVVDISGRPYLVFDAELGSGAAGAFDAELTEEFFRALSSHARITIHLMLRRGNNLHHCIEALFKAFAQALRAAVAEKEGRNGVPSTKGVIEP